jgi:hypothetical protein
VLCSVLKWCWSRLPGGVVTWPVYEAFKIGEKESNQARHAFETFIPIAAESPARKNIVVDFFDLLAAVAAHGGPLITQTMAKALRAVTNLGLRPRTQRVTCSSPIFDLCLARPIRR